MQFIKSVISVFLLLTYSIGFAHDLIPHCHIDGSTEHAIEAHEANHHHLEHHNHAITEHIDDDDDVLHENHLDDSLFDYVVCLLSTLDHQASDEAHQHINPENTTHVSIKGLAKNKFASLHFAAEIDPTDNKPFFLFNRNRAVHYQAPFAVAAPHRGPPSFYC